MLNDLRHPNHFGSYESSPEEVAVPFFTTTLQDGTLDPLISQNLHQFYAWTSQVWWAILSHRIQSRDSCLTNEFIKFWWPNYWYWNRNQNWVSELTWSTWEHEWYTFAPRLSKPLNYRVFLLGVYKPSANGPFVHSFVRLPQTGPFWHRGCWVRRASATV